MLGAGALGRPRGMEWGGRREEGSGWGTQSCFFIAEHRKCFLEKETTPRKNAITIVEMVTQGLEHYISLVDKAVTGFKRIDSSFERGFVVAKC